MGGSPPRPRRDRLVAVGSDRVPRRGSLPAGDVTLPPSLTPFFNPLCPHQAPLPCAYNIECVRSSSYKRGYARMPSLRESCEDLLETRELLLQANEEAAHELVWSRSHALLRTRKLFD